MMQRFNIGHLRADVANENGSRWSAAAADVCSVDSKAAQKLRCIADLAPHQGKMKYEHIMEDAPRLHRHKGIEDNLPE